MITTADEYYRALFRIQDQNPPSIALLPYSETTYKVDLNKRTIETPKFLSVAKDHKAENIYFEVDRYCDYMDLTTCCCIVQYEAGEGATKRSGIYAVPFYDITTPNAGRENRDKMLVPWCLDGNASMYAGPITYALRFYRLNADGNKFIYNLNTTPVKSEILYGMDVQTEDLSGNFDILPTEYDKILERVVKLENTFDVYWLELY